MTTTTSTSPEPPILRERAEGKLSCDVAFGQLYGHYAPLVRGWAALSVRTADADDLAQDVWAIFYQRWRAWRFLPEMYAPEARPVLSFLYRTYRFLLEGHRRRAARVHEPLDDLEIAGALDQTERMHHMLEVGECLAVARRICSPEEMDVLLAKLAGVPAREIAHAHSVTEAVVDHRFRNAINRLQKKMNPKQKLAGRNRKQRPYAT